MCPPVLKLANDYCLEALCYDGNVRYQYLPPDFQAKKEAWLRGRQAAAYKDHESILGEKRPITSWEAPFPREVNKIALLHSSVRLQEVLPLIRDRLAPGLKALLVKPNWLEIIPTGVSKGEALKRIMEETVIQTSEVAVFGDGENDIDMIKTAGVRLRHGQRLPLSQTGGLCRDRLQQSGRHSKGPALFRGARVCLITWHDSRHRLRSSFL